jgi:hypothetical protein
VAARGSPARFPGLVRRLLPLALRPVRRVRHGAAPARPPAPLGVAAHGSLACPLPRPLALTHGGVAPARSPLPPPRSSLASIWLARPGAACPPRPRLGLARSHGGSPARGRPGPSLARGLAWRRSSPAPSSATAPRPAPPRPRGALPARGSARPCARPIRRGGVACPSATATRPGQRPTSCAAPPGTVCSRGSAVTSRRGVPPGIPARLRQPARLARGGLARVCGSGPRPRSLTRVVYSPVQRLTITLSHLSFRCELSRCDVLRQLKVLVLIERCQEAAIIRHGLIMLR